MKIFRRRRLLLNKLLEHARHNLVVSLLLLAQTVRYCVTRIDVTLIGLLAILYAAVMLMVRWLNG